LEPQSRLSTRCFNNKELWPAHSGADTSKPSELHIERASCRDRRPLAAPAELNGPYLATTVVGVRATLTAQASAARSAPDRASPHSATVEFCSAHPDFTPLHLRTSRCKSAVNLPKPSMHRLLPVITELLTQAVDVRGTVLREAAWDALFFSHPGPWAAETGSLGNNCQGGGSHPAGSLEQRRPGHAGS
jgi:hypothetical protein